MSTISEKPANVRGETMASLPGRHRWRQDGTRLARLAIVAGLIAAGFVYLAWRGTAPAVSGTSSCSTQVTAFDPGATPATSSVHTIKQAYNCIIDNYPVALDDRRLLQHAMGGLVEYLVQQHQDQQDAILPALTGNRQTDWQAFERSYTAITAHLSLDQGSLVSAAIQGMIDGLHDDHALYVPASVLNSDNTASQTRMRFGLGLHLPVDNNHLTEAPFPLFIQSVDPGSPAEKAGLRPGDIITAINGLSPFIGHQPVSEIINQLASSAPIQLQIQRSGAHDPSNLHLAPAAYPAIPTVSSRILTENILYVRLTAFETGVTDQIRTIIQQARGSQLTGLILDLRGNGGGSVTEEQRLLSLFVHNQILMSTYDRQGQRTNLRTIDTLPLFHLHLVALIDRGCASACDATSMDIHDLHLGRLVGERTAGAVSGPSLNFSLDDGSLLSVPLAFMQGPAGEIPDGIGVPPDDQVYPTAAELASGHDPILEKALQDLQ